MTLFETEPTSKKAESELQAAKLLFDRGYLKITTLEAIQSKIMQKYGIVSKLCEGLPFPVFWDLYGKKVGDKDNTEKLWNNLTLKIQNTIIETLPRWKLQFETPKYQPYAETYINQKRWNDELTQQNTPTQNNRNSYSDNKAGVSDLAKRSAEFLKSITGDVNKR